MSTSYTTYQQNRAAMDIQIVETVDLLFISTPWGIEVVEQRVAYILVVL